MQQAVQVSLADALSASSWEPGPTKIEVLECQPEMLEPHLPQRIELPSGAVEDSAKPIDSLDAADAGDEAVDAKTPKKIRLPAGALAMGPPPEAMADEEPIALGRLPRSPPPASPPTLAIRLSTALPPSPPPSLSASFSPSMSAALPATVPRSPPPAAPPSFPAAFAEEDLAAPGAAEPPAGPPSAPQVSPLALAAELPPEALGWVVPKTDFTFFGAAAAFSHFPSEMDYGVFGLPPPMVPGAQALPSNGSDLHGTGQCRPCAWFWKPMGCQNGRDCGHCHLCPEGEIKARKKAKHTFARLGLVTPKLQHVDDAPLGVPSFFSDQETIAGSPLTTCDESGSKSAVSDQDDSSDEPTVAAMPDYPPGLEPASDADCAGPAAALGALDSPQAHSVPEAAPNTGSALHGTGTCRPCAWFWKPVGCQNDRTCNYCHLCPESELKNRKKSKQAMMRMGCSPTTSAAEPLEAKFALSLASLL
uniref:C3H1-type domain-containing protein n=1 Tax=Zooxanthella nutricula TaxID=1333877 RepID=A0A6U6PDE9_9DINO|mmetsp:Transcript_58012/g.176726  ORF Transcript_58012/g.176726 Transcript_58012/m.176726 type:complete len:476 (+) Transcript_58012:93-1520(+)